MGKVLEETHDSGYRHHSVLLFNFIHHLLCLDFISVSLSASNEVTASFPCWVCYCSSIFSQSSQNLSSVICFCLLSWSMCTCSSMLFKKSFYWYFREDTGRRDKHISSVILPSFLPGLNAAFLIHWNWHILGNILRHSNLFCAI